MKTQFTQTSNSNLRRFGVNDLKPTYKPRAKSCVLGKVVFEEPNRTDHPSDNVDLSRTKLNVVKQYLTFEQTMDMLKFDKTQRYNHNTHWYQQNGKLVSSMIKVLKVDKPIAQMSEQEREQAISYLKDFERQLTEKFFKGCPKIQSVIHMDEKNPHIHISFINHNGDHWISNELSDAIATGKFKKWELSFNKSKEGFINIKSKNYLYGMKQKDYKNMKSYWNYSNDPKFNGKKIGYADHMKAIESNPLPELIRDCKFLLQVQQSLIKYENGTNKHLIRYFDPCPKDKNKQEYFNEQVEEFFKEEVFKAKNLSLEQANELKKTFLNGQKELLSNEKGQKVVDRPKDKKNFSYGLKYDPKEFKRSDIGIELQNPNSNSNTTKQTPTSNPTSNQKRGQ